jgi:hypothetical protein
MSPKVRFRTVRILSGIFDFTRRGTPSMCSAGWIATNRDLMPESEDPGLWTTYLEGPGSGIEGLLTRRETLTVLWTPTWTPC